MFVWHFHLCVADWRPRVGGTKRRRRTVVNKLIHVAAVKGGSIMELQLKAQNYNCKEQQQQQQQHNTKRAPRTITDRVRDKPL